MPDSTGEHDNSADTVPYGTYLGFDFGLKRIGVASGNTTTLSSTPLACVANRNGQPDWQHIDALVNEWQPAALVVGRPVQMDGSVQDMTHHAAGFQRRLDTRYRVPVFAADERQTSISASALLKKNRQLRQRRRVAAGDIDKVAASEILQRWLLAHFE